jgi:hypothetical protein
MLAKRVTDYLSSKISQTDISLLSTPTGLRHIAQGSAELAPEPWDKQRKKPVPSDCHCNVNIDNQLGTRSDRISSLSPAQRFGSALKKSGQVDHFAGCLGSGRILDSFRARVGSL